VCEVKQIVVDGEHVVVEVRGEIDLRTAPALGDQLDRAFEDAAAAVIVDLSAATFLDSSGLNVLFNARRRLAAGRPPGPGGQRPVAAAHARADRPEPPRADRRGRQGRARAARRRRRDTSVRVTDDRPGNEH
jgi:hypothetical protein